jgi:hypothetical protein
LWNAVYFLTISRVEILLRLALLEVIQKAKHTPLSGGHYQTKCSTCSLVAIAIVIVNNAPPALQLGIIVIAADGRRSAAVFAGPET